MRPVDWLVLVGTIALIIGYGTWKTRARRRDVDAYLRGGGDLKWYTIGLSIMATQASAITFLSLPGQAYEDGMGFVQFYLGLPVAMVLLSAIILPIYYRLKVYTAYEYLESRFDRKTRQLTAFLFLLSRGLAAGLSIYAPAIILSHVLGWPLNLTNLGIGLVVIAYTVSGGTRAVSQTQTYQMAVMLGGMAVAFAVIIASLPHGVSFGDALDLGGAFGRMKAVDFSPRFDTRYTFWSGITGGLFVQLAYFGTDQSQVQRYLTGGSLTESRLGLLFNGLVKIPMQLFMLIIGVAMFAFYLFVRPPLFFNATELEAASRQPAAAAKLAALDGEYARAFDAKRHEVDRFLAASHAHDGATLADAKAKLRAAAAAEQALRVRAKAVITQARPHAETKDADYIFIGFVVRHLPAGLVGLLLAVILCAAMSATAAALSSLGTTSLIDFYKRSVRPQASDAHYLAVTKLFIVFWGALAVAFAASASLLDNLVQAVNILGSIFYGPMLGVFLVGFFCPRVRANAAFWSLLIAQALVVAVFKWSTIGFLWYNVIGCATVLVLANLASLFNRPAPAAT